MTPSSNNTASPAGCNAFTTLHTLHRVAPASLLQTQDITPANNALTVSHTSRASRSLPLPPSCQGAIALGAHCFQWVSINAGSDSVVPRGKRIEGEGQNGEAGEQDAGLDDEVWAVVPETGRLGIELWVPPAKQKRFRSVQVQVAADSTLGIDFRCRGPNEDVRRRKRPGQDFRRGRQRVHRPPLLENGIEVRSFDAERNPHVRAVEAVVPIGSMLQLWDGEPVESALKFEHLVAQMRNQHFSRRRGDNVAAGRQALDDCPTGTVVTLTFALPLSELRSYSITPL